MICFFWCFAALDRPLLNSVWQERISSILDIEDRRYNIFTEPDLLATFSLGPVPSSLVKALERANKKRGFSRQYISMTLFYSFIVFLTLVRLLFAGIHTMKLNKSRLKHLAQSGEVVAAPISLKRKKPDEGSSKQSEEAPSRPSVPVITPPVVPTAVPSVQKARPSLWLILTLPRRQIHRPLP